MLAVATCNYPDTVPGCNGISTVFDGIAWLPDSDDSRDMCILKADGSEGIFLCGLDLRHLRDYRKSETLGSAYRHPKKYGLLTDTTIEPPFVRADYRE